MAWGSHKTWLSCDGRSPCLGANEIDKCGWAREAVGFRASGTGAKHYVCLAPVGTWKPFPASAMLCCNQNAPGR